MIQPRLGTCLALVLLANSAAAEVLTFAFTGTVTDKRLPFAGLNPAIGAKVTGSFGYDTATPPLLQSDPKSATYRIDSPYSLRLEVNGIVVENDGFFNVSITDDLGGNVEDMVVISGYPIVNGVRPPATGDSISLTLASGPTRTDVISGTALPVSYDLSAFDASQFRYGGVIDGVGGNAGAGFYFSIDQLTRVPAIPEPSTWTLGALGGVWLAGRLRRTRARRAGAATSSTAR